MTELFFATERAARHPARSRVITLRLTHDEYDAVKEFAHDARLSMNAFLIKLLREHHWRNPQPDSPMQGEGVSVERSDAGESPI